MAWHALINHHTACMPCKCTHRKKLLFNFSLILLSHFFVVFVFWSEEREEAVVGVSMWQSIGTWVFFFFFFSIRTPAVRQLSSTEYSKLSLHVTTATRAQAVGRQGLIRVMLADQIWSRGDCRDCSWSRGRFLHHSDPSGSRLALVDWRDFSLAARARASTARTQSPQIFVNECWSTKYNADLQVRIAKYSSWPVPVLVDRGERRMVFVWDYWNLGMKISFWWGRWNCFYITVANSVHRGTWSTHSDSPPGDLVHSRSKIAMDALHAFVVATVLLASSGICRTAAQSNSLTCHPSSPGEYSQLSIQNA